MGVSVLAGGWLAGRNVVDTLGHGLVPANAFTLPAATGVLLFTGLGILVGNVRAVSVSTSETAVGAIAGLGAARSVLDWHAIAIVASWWLVAPLLAFWLSAVVGRYWYPELERRLALESGSRSTAGKLLVLALACYMGFSAGASNVANAVAPLVGAGVVPAVWLFSPMDVAVVFGAGSMAVGAFLIGPRTMETVGNDLTRLSLTGALIVETIAATIITLLSLAGIPASLAITAVTCIIGLGWGRATREQVPDGGQRDAAATTSRRLFDQDLTHHVLATWVISPVVAFTLSFVAFELSTKLALAPL
jgi:PiT family inorganic phosphate transporter